MVAGSTGNSAANASAKGFAAANSATTGQKGPIRSFEFDIGYAKDNFLNTRKSQHSARTGIGFESMNQRILLNNMSQNAEHDRHTTLNYFTDFRTSRKSLPNINNVVS